MGWCCFVLLKYITLLHTQFSSRLYMYVRLLLCCYWSTFSTLLLLERCKIVFRALCCEEKDAREDGCVMDSGLKRVYRYSHYSPLTYYLLSGLRGTSYALSFLFFSTLSFHSSLVERIKIKYKSKCTSIKFR